jgi:NAD(P)-dependent dehydrogenase (short-subunit alcohol dehydrogenase family)
MSALARVAGVPEAVHGVAGRVVLVTGAGQGIGLGVARHLVANGARVVVAERSERRGLAAVELLGDAASFVPTDVGSEDSCHAAVQAALATHGRLDGLVCNAQSFKPTAPLATVSAEDAEVFWRTGPQGTLWLMQAAHPVMAAQRFGRIVTVGSAVGVTGMPGYGVYGASKEAIRSLTRTAAREWGRDGITVNCICPGAASPRGLDAAARDEAAHLEHMKTHPVGRMGDPEHDIAPVVLFLLSDASRWLNGQTLMVDGGGTLYP